MGRRRVCKKKKSNVIEGSREEEAGDVTPVAEEATTLAEKAIPVEKVATPVGADAREIADTEEKDDGEEVDEHEEDDDENEENADGEANFDDDVQDKGDDDEEDEEKSDDDDEDEEKGDDDEEKGDDDDEDDEKDDEDDRNDDGQDRGDDEEEDEEKDEEERNVDSQERVYDVDDDEEEMPMQPEKMFFGPSEYTKFCKINTRCSVTRTVKYIEKFSEEVKSFRNHSQFKHVFHMPKEANHMSQGMWMLLLRTAGTSMERECWFVVNGVPIRYSLKEHALLTGLDCHDYTGNYEENLGSKKFVKRVFKRKSGIKIRDVEKKLEQMKSKSSLDRQKLLVLYFLCKVVVADSKADGNIDSFILKVVDDLNACETFPWGRYTFEKLLKSIRGVVKKMKGSVKPSAQKKHFWIHSSS